MVAALVDEPGGHRPDGVGSESATGQVGPLEQVDAGMAELGIALLGGLDVADDGAVALDDEGELVGVADQQIGPDALEIEIAPGWRRGSGRRRPSAGAG